MTFLNNLLLLGLIGISIPILIHLFNRRRAKVVEWGAMQFLLGSIVNRRRRVLIEELILMVLRCLLVAVIVLMVARPFAPVGASLAWGLLLPGLLMVAMLGAVGAIMAKTRLMRALAFGAAAALGLLLFGLSAGQNRWYSSLWGNDAAQDIVVILDGSSSMNAKIDGRSNFERAVDEFRQLLGELPPDAHVSLLVSGSTTRIVTPVALDTRSDWNQWLENLKTQGGTFDPIEAFSTAAAVLQQGDHPTKRVVLIADGQGVSWHANDPQQWNLLKSRFAGFTTAPKIVSRFLPLPAAFQNVSVASVHLSRELVGVGHQATLRIRIENTGDLTMASSGLQVVFDEGEAESLEVPELPPGQSVQLELPHRFETAGSQVIQVKWLGQDDLPDDDVRNYSVAVKDRLPVLLIDGASAKRFLDQATAYVEIALAPSSDEAADPTDSSADSATPFVDITTHAAADIPADIDWNAYEVVVLCDVPRLGATHAAALEAFVKSGGGLIIAPGARAEPPFYADWKTADGKPLLPAALQEFVIVQEGETPSRPALDSFEHSALSRLVDSGSSDLGQVDVRAHWKLVVEEGSDAAVGARFDLGDAWIVEHPFGRGRVILLSTSLDDRGNMLPSSISYVPLVHELTYAASSSSETNLNREPAPVVAFELPIDPRLSRAALNSNSDASEDATAAATEPRAERDDSASTGAETDSTWTRVTQVTSPSGEETQARWELHEGYVLVSLTGVSEPGIHAVELPALFASQIPSRVSSSDEANAKQVLPVSILLSPDEARLKPISEADEALISKDFDYFNAADTEQMVAAITGDIPGQELWKIMAVAAVILVLAETYATRWIARRRKQGETQTVSFVSEGERLSTFKDRAQDFLKTLSP